MGVGHKFECKENGGGDLRGLVIYIGKPIQENRKESPSWPRVFNQGIIMLGFMQKILQVYDHTTI